MVPSYHLSNLQFKQLAFQLIRLQIFFFAKEYSRSWKPMSKGLNIAAKSSLNATKDKLKNMFLSIGFW